MTGKAGQDGDSPTPQGGTAWSPAQPAGSVSSASGILSLAFNPALASMKEQECEGHKAMFVSALRLSGTHGLTPKVHYAPGNRGSVYTQSVQLRAEACRSPLWERETTVPHIENLEGAGQMPEILVSLFVSPCFPSWRPA